MKTTEPAKFQQLVARAEAALYKFHAIDSRLAAGMEAHHHLEHFLAERHRVRKDFGLTFYERFLAETPGRRRR